MANNVLANRVERQIKRDQWSPTPMWKQDGHNSTASPFPQRFLSRSRTTPPMFSPFSLLQPLEPGGGVHGRGSKHQKEAPPSSFIAPPLPTPAAILSAKVGSLSLPDHPPHAGATALSANDAWHGEERPGAWNGFATKWLQYFYY